MNVLILEDEPKAAKRVLSILEEQNQFDIHVLDILESVREAVTYLQVSDKPDLGLFDIQLADDTSFALFDEIEILFPVVFITAFDDYLLKAFEYHSIHYLLKPISQEKLIKALEKARDLQSLYQPSALKELNGSRLEQEFSQRFIVRQGSAYIPVSIKDIAYFFTEHRITFVRTSEGETYIMDSNLTEIEQKVDPTIAFRVNRQYLVLLDAIDRFKSTAQNKIELHLNPGTQNPVLISKENAVRFRKWIGNN